MQQKVYGSNFSISYLFACKTCLLSTIFLCIFQITLQYRVHKKDPYLFWWGRNIAREINTWCLKMEGLHTCQCRHNSPPPPWRPSFVSWTIAGTLGTLCPCVAYRKEVMCTPMYTMARSPKTSSLNRLESHPSFEKIEHLKQL